MVTLRIGIYVALMVALVVSTVANVLGMRAQRTLKTMLLAKEDENRRLWHSCETQSIRCSCYARERYKLQAENYTLKKKIREMQQA